jgi:cephalosporin-C deacetylase-like acetyl esterase
MEGILNDIRKEVERAVSLHGRLQSTHEAKAVIEEEFDEFWDEVKVNPKKLSPEEQLKRTDHMYDELIQMAAMCVRTIQDCKLEK